MEIGAVSLFVADLGKAKEFYTRVFGQPQGFEDAESVMFRFGPTIINLLVDSAAPELIGPAEVGTGARFQFTVWVEDADAAAADLAAKGVELVNGPQDRPWGQRTLLFADPDGHLWEYAQTIGS